MTEIIDGFVDFEEEPPTLLNLDCENIDTSTNIKADVGTHFPIPVTILSGFLGSGKSTLIKFILNSPDHGKRIAVIENEYAPSVSSELRKEQELTVESMIIKDGVTNQNLMSATNLMVELPNGCICCTVKDTLVSTLEMILTSAAAKSIDYIIIEMSGMANPGGLASIFWLDDEDDEGQQNHQPEANQTSTSAANKLRLDGIITCVDAKHVSTQIQDTQDDGDEAAQQIAYADRLILNKIDLMDNEDAIIQVIDTMSTINPTAPILRTQYSQIPDLSWILDANCFNAEKVSREYEQRITQTLESYSKCCTITSNTCNTNTCHHRHKHTSNIITAVLNFQGTVDLCRVKTWMAKILWINQDKDSADYNFFDNDNFQHYEQKEITSEHTMRIMRVKGILSVQYENSDCTGKDGIHSMYENKSNVVLDQRKYVIQAVHDLWDILPCETLKFQEEEDRCCKVVVIGRFLDEQYLKDTFSRCLVS